MGKVRLSALGVALAAAVAANAACWRINPDPKAKAQFLSVAEAMQDINVYDGDTLLLDPGSHGNITLNRENITVIGSGYLLDKNTDWTETQTAVMEYVTLSKGSTLEGCTVARLTVSIDNTVRRCKVAELKTTGQYEYPKNNTIEGCLITSAVSGGPNAIIRNNIVSAGVYTVCLSAGDNSLIENNTVIKSLSVGYGQEYAAVSATNSTIRNNIVINTQSGFDGNNVPYSAKNCIDFNPANNNVICNNVLSIPQRYADTNYTNNHFVGASVTDTFVNEGSDDAKFMLLDSSAAKGAATHGGDCGAFGGVTPYVLSGIPRGLPHITEALVPARPTDGKIVVKLKIEAQND